MTEELHQTNAEGARLRAQVVELQLVASTGDQPTKKPRLREDFVPMCVEDAVLSVEVHATGDGGRNLIGQPVGRHEVGFLRTWTQPSTLGNQI